jgi:hypothetical protein
VGNRVATKIFVTLGCDAHQFFVADVGQALFLFNGYGAILPDAALFPGTVGLQGAACANSPVLSAVPPVVIERFYG